MHTLLSPILGVLPAHAFGPRSDPEFVRDVLAARLTSVLLSTLAVFCTYLLGRDAFGRGAGVLAAGILAVSALPIQLAHFGTPDSTSSLLLVLALWRAVAVLQRPTFRNLTMAGAIVGIAAGCEYHLALLFIPLAAAYLFSGTRDLRSAAGAVGAAVLGFFVTNPYILIDAPAFIAATEHTLRIRTVDSGVQYQGRFDAYGPSWAYVVRFALRYGVGIPLTVWMVCGVARSLWRHRAVDLVLLAWVVPYFLLVSASPAKFMRYSAPLIPALAVLAAVVAIEAYTHLRSPESRGLAVILGATLIFTCIYDAAYVGLFSSPDPRTVASNAVLAQPPPHAVAFEELPDGLVNLPYYLDHRAHPVCIANFSRSHLSGARYLMLDDYSEEEHPRMPTRLVDTFLAMVRASRGFHLLRRVDYVPTFMGLTFPIDSSPHDWRYPSHTISVYRLPASMGRRTAGSQCYATVDAAVKVLYPEEVRAAAQTG